MADGGLVDGGPSSAVTVVLASASPARLETLRRAGLDPVVEVSDVDEDAVIAAVRPASTVEMVALLADAKADSVARNWIARAHGQPPRPGKTVVIGCDSMLDLDGAALGKPGDPQVAAQRWRLMRGRTGVLHTGHTVWLLGDDDSARVESGVSSTEVRFADISDAEIDAYIATREPLSVAGGFTIDGLGGWFVDSISGDHHGVVGISLPLLRRLLGTLDIAIPSLWSSPVR